MTISKNNVPVYKALQECIGHYFAEKGISRYANRSFWIKMTVILLSIVAGYCILLTIGERSLLIVLACYLLINLGSTLFVVNVAHDASHHSISKNKSVNHFLSFSWNVMGISKYLWDIQHHFSHHNHTGVPHRDVDIDETVWIRYSPTHRYRAHFRYQHLYAPFLYLLFGIFVIFIKDFIMLYSDKLRSFGVKRLPRFFVVQLIATKLLYVFISLILPVLLLPFSWWQVLIIYIITLGVSSGSMLVVLVIPHINEFAVQHENKVAIKNQDDWVMQQIHSSIDSSPGSKWLSWLLGGLNTHLVHHLFPNICHVHYRELTTMIRQKLSERGIPYTERSFATGVTDHFKFLEKMGMKPAGSGEEHFHSTLFPNNLQQTAD